MYPYSWAITCTTVPALLANWAPLPGWISTLWTNVPTGISLSANELPKLIVGSFPLYILWPTLSPNGAIIYDFFPLSDCIKAILALLLGSYWMDSTKYDDLLSPLSKSIILYFLLCPPPLLRTLILPELLLPAFLFKGFSKK